MSKSILGGLVIIVAVAAAIYLYNRPEPIPATTQERLEAAATKASEAAQEAVDAVSDAAQDAGEAMTTSAGEMADEMKAKVSDALADVAMQVAQVSEETQAQMRQFLKDWDATGVLTEDGIDFARATAAIEASDLSDGAKRNVIAVLTAVRDAPGAFKEKLDALKTLLNT